MPNRDDVIELPPPHGALCLILLIYGAAFFLPIGAGSERGWQFFILGLIYIVSLHVSFPWLANIFLWFGLCRLWECQFEKALWHGVIATLLAIGFLFSSGFLLGPAYCAWLSSMVLLAATSFVCRRARSSVVRQYTYDEILSDPGVGQEPGDGRDGIDSRVNRLG